jgi:hypothetical protein
MAKLKGKSLCKLVGNKMLKKDLEAYMRLIDAPTHVCTKCGRAANSKKNLCQPEKI